MMTHTYQIAGMTCDGCKATVNKLLSSVRGVLKVDINLATGEATVEMEKHVPTSQLVGALQSHPKYSITERNHKQAMAEVPGEILKTWLETYKPLLVVFAFITLISLLSAYQDGTFTAMHWMNNFMAGFFITFSFFKILDLNGFADSYVMYDIVAKRVRAYAFVYPFIELGLGIAYLTGFNPVATNWITIIIMGMSVVGVVQSVLNKRQIQCACLGAVFNLPMSTVTIVEDVLMIGMAIVSLLFI